jgi:hypothetical protein
MNTYLNAEQTVGNITEGNHTIVVEPGHPLWKDFVASNPAPYIPPPEPTPEMITEELAATARADRNARLAACDWTQLSDAQCDQTAWAAYRQSLREVSEQPGFPRSVVWPTPPT